MLCVYEKKECCVYMRGGVLCVYENECCVYENDERCVYMRGRSVVSI